MSRISSLTNKATICRVAHELHKLITQNIGSWTFPRKIKKKIPRMENVTIIGLRVEKFKKNFFKYYQEHFPTLFNITFDPIGTHKTSRAIIGFFLGFFMGVLLYELIIVDLQFDAYTTVCLGGILILMLSIGCAVSIQVIINTFSFQWKIIWSMF